MTAAIAAACGVVGLLAGFAVPVLVERVPEKAPLLAGPYPEIRRWCSVPLGWLIVLGTGALCAGMGLRFGDAWELPAFLVLAVGLVALSVIDLRLYLLPNRLVFPLSGISVVLLAIASLAEGDAELMLRALACGAAAFAAGTGLHLVSPRAMGFGDVKLAFVLGLDLGWLGVGETVLGLVLGFLYAAVVGVVLLATRLRTRKDHVPFGPFMAAGALTAVYVGSAILDWYRG
jgi:leader peptidase (prepilin peptidase)/N-methyltransferase